MQGAAVRLGCKVIYVYSYIGIEVVPLHVMQYSVIYMDN